MRRDDRLQPPIGDRDEVHRRDTVDPERTRRVVAILQAILDNPRTPDEGPRS